MHVAGGDVTARARRVRRSVEAIAANRGRAIIDRNSESSDAAERSTRVCLARPAIAAPRKRVLASSGPRGRVCSPTARAISSGLVAIFTYAAHLRSGCTRAPTCSACSARFARSARALRAMYRERRQRLVVLADERELRGRGDALSRSALLARMLDTVRWRRCCVLDARTLARRSSGSGAVAPDVGRAPHRLVDGGAPGEAEGQDVDRARGVRRALR